jgi:glutamate carboxypeptidase
MPSPLDPTVLQSSLSQRLPAALDLLRQMVAINSWTENRAGVDRLGRLTAEAFASLGFHAERVPSNNAAWGDHLVLTRLGSADIAVGLVSHLDTVFPPAEEERNDFRWQVEGNRVYGPGTHDIKGGTVMMWLVLETLRHQAPALFEDVTWRLFFDSSEEALSHDFGLVCRECLGVNTRAALVFEAEGRRGAVRRLVVARKGRATWRATVSGRGAHAGGRHAQGANAIVELGRVVQRIAELTDYARDLTFNVGAITGGGGLNRVPHAAVAEGEWRAFRPEVFAQARKALLALAGPGEFPSPADGYRGRVALALTSESAPWPRNPQTDRLLALWRQAGARLGLEVEGEQRGGLSDGNLLWAVVPTLDGLGPAGENDHCSERSADGSKVPEYVEIDSFVPKAALNALALVDLVNAPLARK